MMPKDKKGITILLEGKYYGPYVGLYWNWQELGFSATYWPKLDAP